MVATFLIGQHRANLRACPDHLPHRSSIHVTPYLQSSPHHHQWHSSSLNIERGLPHPHQWPPRTHLYQPHNFRPCLQIEPRILAPCHLHRVVILHDSLTISGLYAHLYDRHHCLHGARACFDDRRLNHPSSSCADKSA